MANDCDIHETSAPEDMTIGCLATICSMPNSIYIMPEWNPNKKRMMDFVLPGIMIVI